MKEIYRYINNNDFNNIFDNGVYRKSFDYFIRYRIKEANII